MGRAWAGNGNTGASEGGVQPANPLHEPKA